MIPQSGVIYEFTPPAHKQPQITTRTTSSPVIPKPPQPKRQPIPFKPQTQTSAFPARNKPFPPPPRFKPPFPPLSKKQTPWADPFSYDPFSPQTKPFANAKTLSDIAKPKEYYHGLPIEETPEIAVELPPPSVDTTYVERLFGNETQQESLPTVEAKTEPSQPPQEHSEVNLSPLEQEAVEHIREEIHEHTSDNQTKIQQPVQSIPAKKRSPFDFLRPKFGKKQALGVLIIVLALYGMTIPLIPRLKLEATYADIQKGETARLAQLAEKPLPPSIPIGVNPMMAPDGKIVEPINTEFSIIIPSVGINSPVIAGVNPLDSRSYTKALEQGVAHAKTSYLPGQNGTTYLFSHSTNYEWYVKDLNAIFYNVKSLKPGDYIIVFYQGTRYVYEYKDKKIVKPSDTSYLVPETGKQALILQTCWPPGSTTERLLLFADLISQS